MPADLPPPDTTMAATREASGVRQQTIAKAVGVPLAELAGWEAGGEIPDSPAAEAYARIIGELGEALLAFADREGP